MNLVGVTEAMSDRVCMRNSSPIHLLTRFASAVGMLPAVVLAGPSQNLIYNGDFALGNVGFKSELPYTAPTSNCLWPGAYTIAKSFNDPLLHQLIQPEPFAAPVKHNGKEKVFFANAGGTEQMVVWSSTVKCEPNTEYLISFNCISLSGGYDDQRIPPRQIASMEWVPDFIIGANYDMSLPSPCGCGKYNRVRMYWSSKKATSAIIRIIRDKISHGGGLIGISNIEMVPAPKKAGPETVKG